MFQAKFLVVLMLGIVIQLSFPAAPAYNNASNVQHEKVLAIWMLATKAKITFIAMKVSNLSLTTVIAA